MHISIKKLATAFAGIAFAFGCAWGADPVTIQDAGGADISVYEVSSGFYQSGTTYNNSTDFYITSKAGLLFFRDIVNGETEASYAYFTATGMTGTYPTTPNGIKSFHSNNMFSGKTVHLCEDVDLAGEQWITIGFNRAERTITDPDTSASASVSKCTFYGLFDAGIYDGEGNLTGTHVISNLDTSWQYVPEAATLQEKYQLTGLFGQLSGGTTAGVKNLTVQNATVVGRTDVGVIAGRSYNGGAKIENCHVIGNVNVSGTGSYVGGLVGECRGSIVDSSVAPDAGSSISGLAYVGGLAGSVYQYNTTASVEVSGSAVSNTAVSASYSGAVGVGALVGVTSPSGTHNGNVVITGNDANDVSVTAPNASASSGSVGTLVGYALYDDGAYAIVADNTVSGTTSATAGGDAVTAKMGSANDNIAVGEDVTFDEGGKITGGVFEVINEEVVASGYLTVDNMDGETSASYPLTIGGPYEAVLYDGNNTLIQGYATLQEAFAAANAIEGSDGVTIMILQASVSSGAATITHNLLIDTELAGGATINFNGNSFTAQSGAIVTFSDDVAATGNVDLNVVGGSPVVENAKLVLNNAVLAGGMTVDVNGGEIVINPTARVTLNGSENPIFLAVGNITVNGDLNEGAAQTVTLADVTGAQQLSGSGGYFQGYFGKNIVTLNNTFVSTIWVDYSGYTDYSSYTQYGPAYAGYATDNRFILTNSVLYITNVENANKGFNLGGFNGVLSLTGSRLIASGAPVVVNSGDVANLDVASSITAKTFTNNGVINIDATGIAEPVKVIDYTGSGTMALADYGTVNVTGGTAYVDGNDLWITMPPVAEAYDAEGGTLIGQFATVNEAIAAAGATYVKLLDNVTLTAPLTMINSYTLDFNGKTNYYNTTATTQINGNSNIIFKNGKLDISGAQMSGTTAGNDIFSFNADGNTLTFDNMELYGDGYGGYSVFWFKGNDKTPVNTLNFVNGSSIVLKDEAYGSGGVFKGPGAYHENQFFVVNITDSTVSCTNVYRFSLYGTINVKDSTVTFTGGENAFRQGIFTFDHATVTVSGANANEGKGLVPRFSDTIVTNGSALTFIGSNIGKDVLFEYANNIVIYDTSTVTAASVSGAAADRAIVAPANYVLVTTDNGGASVTYSVAPAVAQIGDVKYTSFAEAIAAAEAYKTENGDYPVITVLDATAEQSNPDWKIANGQLVKKVYVAQIVTNNGATTNKYETVEDALTAAQTAGATIEVLANSTETPAHALEVLMGGDITLTSSVPVRVEIAPTAKTSSVDNDGMAYIRSVSADARCTFTVGENVTLAFPATAAGAGAMYIGYSSANAADMVINGRLELYEPYVGSLSTLTVNPSGSIKSISECLIVRWGATVDIVGTGAEWSDANPQAEFAYVSLQGGVTTLKDTYAKGGAWVQIYDRNNKAPDYATKLVLDNAVLATSKINNQAVIELDVDSQIVTPEVVNTGAFNIDATSITQATKVIDYTGSGTMALADYGTVNVTAGEAYVDENDLWVKKLPTAQVISANGATTNKFSTVMEALSAATTGSTIELLADVDENVTLASWKNNALTIDLGGHTLTGQIIAPYGAKTEGIVIKNGSIVGRDSSSFYCLQFGYGSGNATLENLSITQVSQNYRSYAVFFQQTSKSVTLRNVTLDGRFYTANSQSTIAIESGVYQNSTGLTSSEISNGGVIAARGGTFYYNPTTPNNLVADGYVATETNDVNDVQCWVVELGPAFAIVTLADGTETEFWDLEEAIGALAEGATLTIKPGTYNLANANYTLPKNVTIVGVEENGSRVLIKSKPTFNSANGLTIQNIDFDGGYSWTPPAVTVHGDATFKNCTITGENAVYYSTVNGTLTFDNCTLTADTYALNVGEGTGDVIVKDCTISGWTSFGNTGKTVITGTTFEEGDYNYVRFYQDAVIDDCTFNTNMAININTTGKSLIVSDSAFEDGSSIASVIGEGENDDPVANNYVAVGTNVQLDENGDIVGGIFETIDDELIAAGYLSVDNLESATAERYPLTVGGPFVAVIVDDNGKFVNGYTTLQAAFDEAETSGEKTEIVLVDDAVVAGTDNEFYVAYNWVADVVLDLNGHNVINTCTDGAYGQQHVIVNEGTLTIKDSQDDGTKGGCVYTMTVAQRSNHVIANSGTLTIEGGWFGDSDCDKTNANDLSFGHAVYNTGTAVINGGHFTAVDNNFTASPNRYAYVLCSDQEGATMTINDADVYGAMNGVISATGGGAITVNDGNFYLGRANATTYVYRLIYTTGSSVVEVNGGNWTANNSQKTGEEDFKGTGTSQILLKGGTFTLQNGFPYASEGACGVAVSGGVYSKTVPAYCCATDYSPAANSDSDTSAAYPFTVAANGVAKIVKNGTTTYYASLTQAYDASVAGDTIELLADDHSLADGSELFINHSVTITGAVDGNGKPKYTIYGDPTDNYNVDVFIKNASSAIDVTIQNVNFSEFGHQYGTQAANAALYVSRSTHADTHVLVSNVTFSAYNNYAIIAPQGQLEVVDCTIDGYKDPSYGEFWTGGIWSGDMFDDVPSSTVSVLRTTIINLDSNKSGTTAYAIDARAGSTVTVTDCVITNVHDGIASVAAQENGNGATSVTVSGTTVNADRNALAISGNPTYLGGSVIAELSVSSGTFVGAVALPAEYEDYGLIEISGGIFDRAVSNEFCAAGYVPTANTDAATKDAYPYTVRIGYAKDDEVVVVGDDDYPITQTEADFLNALLDKGGENYSRDAITDALADMSVEDFQEAALLNIDITKTYAKPIFKITAIKRNRTDGTVSVTVTLTRENKVAQPIRGTLILETSSDCVNWDGCQDVQLYDEHFSESDTAVITMPIAKNARIFKAKVVDPAEITSGTGE